jgi:hypothetical protein
MKLPGNPYFVTSLIFLAIVLTGGFLFHWGEEEFAYLLLLYLIVGLGIRLDDISKQMGSGHPRPTQIGDDEESIIGLLKEIKRSSASTNIRLKEILKQIEERNGTEDDQR